MAREVMRRVRRREQDSGDGGGGEQAI